MNAFNRYSPALDNSMHMTREQVQSMLATAHALQSCIPFSSALSGHTYHADLLADLIELHKPAVLALTPAQELEYRELVLRH